MNDLLISRNPLDLWDEFTNGDRVALVCNLFELAAFMPTPELVRLNRIVFRYIYGAYYGELTTEEENYLVDNKLEGAFDLLLNTWRSVGNDFKMLERMFPISRPQKITDAIRSVN